jgi:hypothetical protein
MSVVGIFIVPTLMRRSAVSARRWSGKALRSHAGAWKRFQDARKLVQ